MSILNHTTTIPVSRTLAELAQAIPVPVILEREQGRVTAVTFRYDGRYSSPTRPDGGDNDASGAA